MAQTCRWGILGTANIARKNWKAIRHSGNGTVTAVASRDAAKAQKFIDECQSDVPFDPAPVAVGGYEALLARKDVDAVYIPLPTGIRPEWVVKAAAAGKHVLCEKPCGATAADLKSMLDACAKHGMQFMDGVMFMHSKRLPLLRQVLDDGDSVGPVRRVTSHFTFAAGDEFAASNIRASSALEPLGCLGDLGWYNVRFSLWVMKYQMPETVTGRILSAYGSGPNAVPSEFTGELFFADGVTAGFYCSFRTEIQQWASVGGSRGHVHVPDFVVPFYGAEVAFTADRSAFNVTGCHYHMESHPRRHAVAEYSDGTANAQEANMVRTFGALVAGDKPDPTWGEISLKSQLVLDACLKSARAGGTPVPLERS